MCFLYKSGYNSKIRGLSLYTGVYVSVVTPNLNFLYVSFLQKNNVGRLVFKRSEARFEFIKFLLQPTEVPLEDPWLQFAAVLVLFGFG